MARNAGAWVVGLVTLIPITFTLAWMLGIWVDIAVGWTPLPDGFYSLEAWLGSVVLVTLVAAIYVWHALRNPAITGDSRWVWPMLLIVGNALAMPVYWWFFIRPDGRNARHDPLKRGLARHA